MERSIVMAIVHVPNSIGMDLPAGASSDDLTLDDYRAVEMPHRTVEWALVPVPNSFGMDLPAGASASELAPTDYRIVEIGDHLPR